MANELELDLLVRTEKLEAAVKKATQDLSKLEKTGKDAGDGITGSFGDVSAGFLKGAAIVTGLTATIVGLTNAYREQELAEQKTIATLKATGGAAGLTAQEIFNLSGAMQEVTTFSDDAVLGAENLLLSFTNIGKETFPKATEAALDLATALGTDATSAAQTLGKALNNPTQGLSALSRVGIQFSGEQKQQIEDFMRVNDVASAQAIILENVTSKFGGMARAVAGGLGAVDMAKNKMGELSETIGKALAPVVSLLAEKISVAATYWADFLTKDDTQNVQAMKEELTTLDAKMIELEKSIKASKTANEEFARNSQSAFSGYVNNLTIAQADTKKFQQEYADTLVRASELRQELAKKDKEFQERNSVQSNDSAKVANAERLANEALFQEELRNLKQQYSIAQDEEFLTREQFLIQQQEAEKLRDITAKAQQLQSEGQFLEARQTLKNAASQKELAEIQKQNASKQKALTQSAQAEIQIESMKQQAIVGLIQSGANLSEATLKKNSVVTFALQKAAAIAQTIVATNLGAAQALSLGPPGIPIAAIIKTAGYINLAAIAATTIKGFAEGGMITGGIPNKDSVPAMLQQGELVAPRKNFDEVIDAVARQRGYKKEGTTSSDAMQIIIGFREEAFQLIEAKLNERRVLGVV